MVLLLVALAGCTGAPRPAGPAAGSTAGATVGTTAGPAAGTATAPAGDDPVDVYAAAIDRYLTGADTSFGGTRFPVVFVLDRLDPAAAGPSTAAGGAAGFPLTPAQQHRIDTLVADALTFVPGLDAATADTPGDSCAVVRDGGVFLALGPATVAGAGTAHVAVHGYVACMGATWFTYVLRRDTTGWTVAGTTGAMSVS